MQAIFRSPVTPARRSLPKPQKPDTRRDSRSAEDACAIVMSAHGPGRATSDQQRQRHRMICSRQVRRGKFIAQRERRL